MPLEGHCADSRLVPAATEIVNEGAPGHLELVPPPSLMCESHIPAPPFCPAGCLTFHSTTIAPGAVMPQFEGFKNEIREMHTGSHGGKYYVANLHNALRIRGPYLHNGLRVVYILESST